MNPTPNGVASGSIDAGLNDKFIDAITGGTALRLSVPSLGSQGSRQARQPWALGHNRVAVRCQKLPSRLLRSSALTAAIFARADLSTASL
jgi:hypothetical protein